MSTAARGTGDQERTRDGVAALPETDGGSGVAPPQSGTRHPFTVAVCRCCGSDPELAVLKALGRMVRSCQHGVLISIECPGKPSTRRPADIPTGVTVLLQPCTVERVPLGPAQQIGPLTTAADVAAVCEWVKRGHWTAQALRRRLRGPDTGSASMVHLARRN